MRMVRVLLVAAAALLSGPQLAPAQVLLARPAVRSVIEITPPAARPTSPWATATSRHALEAQRTPGSVLTMTLDEFKALAASGAPDEPGLAARIASRPLLAPDAQALLPLSNEDLARRISALPPEVERKLNSLTLRARSPLPESTATLAGRSEPDTGPAKDEMVEGVCRDYLTSVAHAARSLRAESRQSAALREQAARLTIAVAPRLSAQDREDVAQSAFVRLLRACAQVMAMRDGQRVVESPFAYFARIVVNMAKTRGTRIAAEQRACRAVDTPQVLEGVLDESVASPECNVIAASLYRHVITALTPREREVLNLRLLGLSREEIAQALGVGEERVKELAASLRKKAAVQLAAAR